MQDRMAWEPANIDLSMSYLSHDSRPLSSMLDLNEDTQEDITAEVPYALTSTRSMNDFQLSDLSSASDISTKPPADLGFDSICHPTWLNTHNYKELQTYSSRQSTSSRSSRQLSDSPWKTFDHQPSRRNSPQSSFSPYSIDQQMITTSNNHLISENLLQIYHDVLEHNLSCWLTEMTCPYQLGSRTSTKIIPEWGSSWSNRIYQRTIKLDRVLQSSKFLQMTRSEDQAASKALHFAIMAFATQWAQGSNRHREKHPTVTLHHGEDESNISNEFDRILQRHFWDQAQCALQQVAAVESYRVACAEMIFGLTQRPWNPDEQTLEHEIEAQGHRSAINSVFLQASDIIRKEGPPIYMESAARKMHALKFRCDALEAGLGRQYGSREKAADGIADISPEDRGTIGLLYWLAIMFDTISSSMNERPVVVMDEDCEHDAQKRHRQVSNLDNSTTQSRWNLKLFVQESIEETHQTHWPCSYETAAEDIVKSAPVKVLLFRHLSYLQNAVRKSSHGKQIEEIIHSTMSLYQYWNKTHGAFFDELVQNYSLVPQRIQGWFVCISAHWHLAALMLADLLEFIDDNALGIEDAAYGRINSQMARGIRNRSAQELSDLARVATPPAEDAITGVPQMPDFHHATNEGTLLTEPWTMILIRAFTKACMVFLSEADESLCYTATTFGHTRLKIERNMERAENCMKGLWLLGKKSDMARRIAEILSLALRKLRNECLG
ncbi:uncharacterized protein N7503_003321 [Penicillium pulvis]|uniref:uncharacterized protein n=1 Tax=Penicillium pulvis TaxID=1562058 RepID=UPI0025498108|nr:uncharacterized protein N7503_003321 [Penicillium pulvis]KAJ5805719.1 hypothetical protein N7503_003321 [Penicillium pulvis]